MKIHNEHSWKVSFEKGRAIQEKLKSQWQETGRPRKIHTIAGADVSYEKKSDYFFAAVVLLSFPDLELIEVATATGTVKFPYVPGYLVFREGPVLVKAFKKLTQKPDLVVFDGHGLAHPRRFGIACHMGVLLDVPSIGCGKTRLIGEHREPATRKGSRRSLMFRGDVVGRVLRTRNNTRPVFVSVGHRVNLDNACRIILRCCQKYRIPEPTRQAHMAVNQLRIVSRNPQN